MNAHAVSRTLKSSGRLGRELLILKVHDPFCWLLFPSHPPPRTLPSLCCAFAAGFQFDLPFGVLPSKDAPWDRLLTQEEMQQALRSFAAVNTQSSWFASLNCDFKAGGDVVRALEGEGYKNITPVYWVKEGFNQVCPQAQLARACETIVTARISRSQEPAYHNLDTDPSKRLNIISGPPNRHYQMRPDGKKVNPAEKPEYVFRWFLDRFARPGEWVLICGAGAGGEVRAAIKAGLNVVAIDSDKEQCQFLHDQITTMDARADQEAKRQAAKEEKKKGAAKGDSDVVEKTAEIDAACCSICGCLPLDGGVLLPCTSCAKKVCKREGCGSGEVGAMLCLRCVAQAKSKADDAAKEQ